MKAIIVYSSRHHGNTEKVARAMATELSADLKPLADAKPADLDGFDLVGLGSAINRFDVHPEMTAFVRGLTDRSGQKAFIFSTCASGKDFSTKLRDLMVEKNFQVVGEFHCTGLWTPGPFKVRDGHPDETDLENARAFARSLR